MEGGSENGCRERGYEGTINGEPYAYIDKDNDRVRKMITKIREVGDAMTGDHRRKAIAEIQGDGGEGNLPYSQHLRGTRFKAEDAERDRVHKDEGTGQGARHKDGGAGRRRRNKAKEEQKETSSESSDTEGEKEVNRVIRDQVWPGTRATARKRNVRHKAVKDNKNKGESKSSDEDEESYPGGEQEIYQVTWDHGWPGTREKAKKRNSKHTAVEGGKDEDKGAGRHRRIKAKGAGCSGKDKGKGAGRHEAEMNKDEGAGRGEMYKDKGAA